MTRFVVTLAPGLVPPYNRAEIHRENTVVFFLLIQQAVVPQELFTAGY